MKLEHAHLIAESLKSELAPFCKRIEIGGSIRRKKPEPKDIELVAIPKFAEVGTGQATLFGGEIMVTENLLFGYLTSKSEYSIERIGGKYCQFCKWYESEDEVGHIKIDLFTATKQTWGYIFLIRTGPWEFSRWVVMELERRGFTPEGGAIWAMTNRSILEQCDTLTEERVFRMLGIDYIDPSLRQKFMETIV